MLSAVWVSRPSSPDLTGRLLERLRLWQRLEPRHRAAGGDQQHVLGHERVPPGLRDGVRVLERPAHVLREVDLASAAGDLGEARELLVERLPGRVGRAAGRLDHAGREPRGVGEERRQEVERRDLLMLPRPRDLLSAGDHLQSGLGEAALVHASHRMNLSEVMSSFLVAVV